MLELKGVDSIWAKAIVANNSEVRSVKGIQDLMAIKPRDDENIVCLYFK